MSMCFPWHCLRSGIHFCLMVVLAFGVFAASMAIPHKADADTNPLRSPGFVKAHTAKPSPPQAHTPNQQTEADLIVLYKGERIMHLMSNGRVLRSFRVALGQNPVGHKHRQGDSRTPEGAYKIDLRLRDSQYHRAIRVSYPNARDRAFAKRMGLDPGGQIMIHGLPNGKNADYVGHPYADWTNGCIAVDNEEMDYIWRSVSKGTRVVILP